ncbi:O-antigen ligase [uncultured Adlercreutzia sp.]|uniref:O-antigen ligase family protein n=1 Tax=uncultured Adlercreutzia sp. TaxID=875803 RepID=UPI002600718B|nr:O-antigen ligase family protein [uncultured Adlercreutzia sp.]MCI9262879.1 O-antigen ligase family protein [Eggerthellaceae bacterium]
MTQKHTSQAACFWQSISPTSKSTLIAICLAIAIGILMRPGIVMKLGDTPLHHTLDTARFILALASIAIYFLRVKVDAFGLLVIALGALAFLSIAFNGQTSYYFTEFWLPSCASALLARALCPKYRDELILAIFSVSSAFSVINLASIIMYPGGIPSIGIDNYFCGNRNWSITAILPSVISSLMIDDRQGKAITPRSCVAVIIGYAQLALATSATSLAVFLCATLIGILLFSKARRVFTLFTYIVLYLTSFLLVTFVGFDGPLAAFVHDVFNRDATFSGRTEVWRQAIANVLSTNMLIGCGRDTYIVDNSQVGSAHSMLLEVFVQGGLLGIAVWLSILILVASRLYRNRDCRSSALVSLAIGSFLFIGLMEQTRWPALFLFLGIGYSSVFQAGSVMPSSKRTSSQTPLLR